MSFDSPLYLVFLLTVAVLYRVLPRSVRSVLLLLASAVFYAMWNVPLTLLLYGVILVTYATGRWLEKTASSGHRTWILAGSIALCIGLLLYFKYFRFLAESVHAVLSLFGYRGTWKLWDIILPVGVSFYTFQAMSYVIDVYRGTVKAEKSLLYYALYISFFPQLVAGPIERAGTLLPQLREAKTADSGDIRTGIRYLLSGLFRKIVIADFCGMFADRVFSDPAPDGSAVALGALLFSIQIYCDFAGYSEIARGSARLLGVRLMQNFDRPYRSENLRDFWRRWHISLSGWLTDYIYIPMGGSRKGILRQTAAVMTVFLISGLWHGANLTFVLWGALHGAGMILTILWIRRARTDGPNRFFRELSICLTFTIVTLLWILFRAESLNHAQMLYGRLFSGWNVAQGLGQTGITWEDGIRLALSIAAFPLLARLNQEEKTERNMTYVFLVIVIAAAWVIRITTQAGSAFIYFQF